MNKVDGVFCLAMSALLWGVYHWLPTSWDERKILEHNRRCNELSGEEIYRTVNSNSVNLHDVPFPKPVGTAGLPVLDLKYDRAPLSDKLLTGSDALQEVRFTFEIPIAKVTDPKCGGTFSVLAKQPGDVYKSVGSCDNRINFTQDFLGTYSIDYVHGSVDGYSIRSFDLLVVNRTTREVIAKQKQFQLLLGDMNDRDTRVLLGYGSAQGVRTCQLSLPAEFIKRAMGRRSVPS